MKKRVDEESVCFILTPDDWNQFKSVSPKTLAALSEFVEEKEDGTHELKLKGVYSGRVSWFEAVAKESKLELINE